MAAEGGVEGGPMTVNQIASELRLDKSTASRVAQSLEQKGLAVRAEHPADGRSLQIGVTARGRRLYARVLSESIACYGALLEDVSLEVQTAVVDLLQRLSRPDSRPASCRSN